jgi:hypothetical protein
MRTVSELGRLAARATIKAAMAGALPDAIPAPKPLPVPRPNRLRTAPGLYAGGGFNIGLDGKPAASAALPTRDDLRRQSWAAESARIKKEQTPKKDWSAEAAPLQLDVGQGGVNRRY